MFVETNNHNNKIVTSLKVKGLYTPKMIKYNNCNIYLFSDNHTHTHTLTQHY